MYRCTLVNILFLDSEEITLSMLKAIEILLDLVILGMTWKAE